MPIKSKAQLRFMQGIAHGWKPGKKGKKKPPSKKVAQEFVRAGPAKKGLPEHVKAGKGLLE